jgi:SnoaL-like protein
MQERLPERRADWDTRGPTAEERELLARFIDAHERCDVAAAVAIASEDLRVTMPPYPLLFDGLDAVQPLMQRGLADEREGDWRLLPTAVNRLPAGATYLRRWGDSEFRAFKLDVLRIRDGMIAEITTFGPGPFEALGLPAILD